MSCMERNELIQYWKNDIKRHIGCVDQPCSFTAVPIVGYFDGLEPYSLIRWIADRQEIGLHFDTYSNNIFPDVLLSDAEKKDLIIEKRDEKPSTHINSVYRGVPVLSLVEGSKKLFSKTASNQIFSESIFLPITTPSQFNYSLVFLTNNGFQGIMHTFLRHHSQWDKVDSSISSSIKKLEPIREQFEAVERAYNMRDARSKIGDFLNKLRDLKGDDFENVQRAINEVQISIVRTLQDNCNYKNYKGEGVNEKGQLQTYFRMADDLVAVLGVSRELFLPETDIDSRPLRTIITIYFIDQDECTRRSIMRSY